MSAVDTSPIALIDTLNNTFGRHAGARASHAKGFCAVGEFVPDSGAQSFVKNSLFESRNVHATVRFSVAGGNPKAPDKSRSARGIAIRLQSASEFYDIIMLSEPVFFAATLESFVSFIKARIPDPATGKPDPAKVAAHNAAFPDGAHQPALIAAHAAPASYATTPYFTNNAFVFTGSDGVSRPARLNLLPDAGTRYLTEQEEASLPDPFLEKELDERLLRGPIGFTLEAHLPDQGDSLTDSTTTWSGTQRITLGKLFVKALTAGDCDHTSFVPTNLPANIALSDDPILRARKAAYAVSEARRTLTSKLGD